MGLHFVSLKCSPVTILYAESGQLDQTIPALETKTSVLGETPKTLVEFDSCEI